MSALAPKKVGSGAKAQWHYCPTKGMKPIYGNNSLIKNGVYIDNNLVLCETFNGQCIIGYVNDSHSSILSVDQMYFLSMQLLRKVNEARDKATVEGRR